MDGEVELVVHRHNGNVEELVDCKGAVDEEGGADEEEAKPGRLFCKSHGGLDESPLLLLTNDGEYNNQPHQREIEKSMMVVDEEAVEEGGESNCNTIR